MFFPFLVGSAIAADDYFDYDGDGYIDSWYMEGTSYGVGFTVQIHDDGAYDSGVTYDFNGENGFEYVALGDGYEMTSIISGYGSPVSNCVFGFASHYLPVDHELIQFGRPSSLIGGTFDVSVLNGFLGQQKLQKISLAIKDIYDSIEIELKWPTSPPLTGGATAIAWPIGTSPSVLNVKVLGVTGTLNTNGDWGLSVPSSVIPGVPGDWVFGIVFTDNPPIDLAIFSEDLQLQEASSENPANLPVNGDYDEERYSNGTLIRDFETPSIVSYNAQIGLQLSDLIPCGFVIPRFDSTQWEGVSLKIRKVAGVTDPDTNEEEAGEVRVHALRSDDDWVEVPLDTNLIPEFYHPDGDYKDYDDFWIEGIAPGKITLELELEVNSTNHTAVSRKKLNVCTEKTKAEWLNELRKEIDILSDVNMNGFVPAQGFDSNKEYIQAVYLFYEKMYARNEAGYQWAGLAKLAGAPVYAGLTDLDVADFAVNFSLFHWVLLNGDIDIMKETFMEMNLAVYNDMAWQFKAYHTSGLGALEYVADSQSSDLNITAWRLLDSAIGNSDQIGINSANNFLLEREQFLALKDGYETLESLGFLTYAMSWLTENPVPGGVDFDPGFLSVGIPTPGLDLEDFNDRWAWIMRTPGGIWTTWVAASSVQKKAWVDIPLLVRMVPYSYTQF